MKKEIRTAIREVIEAWDEPDSPEAFACAMYALKRVYRRHEEALAKSGKSRTIPHERVSQSATRVSDPAASRDLGGSGRPRGVRRGA